MKTDLHASIPRSTVERQLSQAKREAKITTTYTRVFENCKAIRVSVKKTRYTIFLKVK